MSTAAAVAAAASAACGHSPQKRESSEAAGTLSAAGLAVHMEGGAAASVCCRHCWSPLATKAAATVPQPSVGTLAAAGLEVHAAGGAAASIVVVAAPAAARAHCPALPDAVQRAALFALPAPHL